MKAIKGARVGVLGQVERISSNRGTWVNELDMEHAQEVIEEFHNRPTNKQKKHRM